MGPLAMARSGWRFVALSFYYPLKLILSTISVRKQLPHDRRRLKRHLTMDLVGRPSHARYDATASVESVLGPGGEAAWMREHNCMPTSPRGSLVTVYMAPLGRVTH